MSASFLWISSFSESWLGNALVMSLSDTFKQILFYIFFQILQLFSAKGLLHLMSSTVPGGRLITALFVPTEGPPPVMLSPTLYTSSSSLALSQFKRDFLWAAFSSPTM